MSLDGSCLNIPFSFKTPLCDYQQAMENEMDSAETPQGWWVIPVSGKYLGIRPF